MLLRLAVLENQKLFKHILATKGVYEYIRCHKFQVPILYWTQLGTCLMNQIFHPRYLSTYMHYNKINYTDYSSFILIIFHMFSKGGLTTTVILYRIKIVYVLTHKTFLNKLNIYYLK